MYLNLSLDLYLNLKPSSRSQIFWWFIDWSPFSEQNNEHDYSSIHFHSRLTLRQIESDMNRIPKTCRLSMNYPATNLLTKSYRLTNQFMSEPRLLWPHPIYNFWVCYRLVILTWYKIWLWFFEIPDSDTNWYWYHWFQIIFLYYGTGPDGPEVGGGRGRS